MFSAIFGIWGSGSPRAWGACSGGSIPPIPTVGVDWVFPTGPNL